MADEKLSKESCENAIAQARKENLSDLREDIAREAMTHMKEAFNWEVRKVPNSYDYEPKLQDQTSDVLVDAMSAERLMEIIVTATQGQGDEEEE